MRSRVGLWVAASIASTPPLCIAQQNVSSGKLVGLVDFARDVPGGCAIAPNTVAPGSGFTILAAPPSSAMRPLLMQPPLAGTFDTDVAQSTLFDDQPGPGMFDWNCTNHCYDGHNGLDLVIKSFGEQAAGVPIFAALDGVIEFAHDGEPDMNTIPMGQVGNEVVIDHGFGRRTLYAHMKLGSVAVSVADFVRAGQQIGSVGSSGNSAGPHLHFGVIDDFVDVDPSVGPCRAGASAWASQPQLDYAAHLWDFGFSRTDLSTWIPPASAPRTGQLELADASFWPWLMFMDIPPNSDWRFEFIRPNGTLEYDSGPVGFNNPTRYLDGGLYWNWFIGGMHTTTGTWHVKLSINGALLIDAPVEVVATFNPSFNRPPEAIAVSFDPAQPNDGMPTFARVASLAVDDKDYDLLSYHYVWKVNGVTVRDVTIAGQADAIPHHTALAGQTLSCQVTPLDAVSSGPAASASSVVVAGCTQPFAYCTAKINSLGCAPSIGFSGTASATATSGFVVSASFARNNKSGLLFYGFHGTSALPFQNGFLCVKSPTLRAPLGNSGGNAAPADDCSGVYSLDLAAFAHGSLGGSPSPLLSTPGTRVDCQWWGRDTGFAPPNNTTLSNALEFWICP